MPSREANDCFDFDDMLPIIGEFGRYQKMLILLMCPFVFLWAFIYLSQIFLSLTPRDHWCYIPELSSMSKEQQLKFIPKKESDYDHCHMYNVNYTHVLEVNQAVNESWPLTGCRSGWVYDRTEVPYTTISTEYNWVCDDDTYPAYAISTFFIGSAIGCLPLGYVADHYGRVPSVMLANLCALIGGTLSAFCKSFWQFAVVRLIAGISYDNCVLPIYILTLEYVGPSYRTLTGNLCIGLFYTPAACALPFIALLCNDWRILALATSLPIIFLGLSYFILPESARWLITAGKIDKAIFNTKQVAKINGKQIPQHVIEKFEECCQLFYHESQSKEHYTLVDLLKLSRLRRNFILILIVWMIIGLIYDAHVRAIINIGPDVFVTFSLANLTELPAALILIPLLDRLGRRCITFLVLLLCGLSSLVASLLKERWLAAAAAISGRFFANICFNVGIQWTAEILPTVLRVQGLSFIHLMGFLATFLSPAIVYTEHISPMFPMQIVTALSIMGSVCTFFLPETLHSELPQTLNEANDLGKNQRNCAWRQA